MKLLMVCLGNICRSPLAQGILESKVPSNFLVDSAGTAAYHIGNPPDHRSVKVASENGIQIQHQRARQFQTTDFEDFDIIYAMDSTNYSDLASLTNNPNHLKKIKLFLDENPGSTLRDVPDPYYGETAEFSEVFKIIEETATLIAKKLM